MSQFAPFAPVGKATVTASVTTANSYTTITSSANLSHRVRVYNAGPNDAFVEFNDGTIPATVAASMPIAAKTVEVFTSQSSKIAAITSSGTATLYVTPGEGF